MSLRIVSNVLVVAAAIGVLLVVAAIADTFRIESGLLEGHRELASLQELVYAFSSRSDALLRDWVTDEELGAFVDEADALRARIASWNDGGEGFVTATEAIDGMVALAREHAQGPPVGPEAPRAGPLQLPVPSLARFERMAALGSALDETMAAAMATYGRAYERSHRARRARLTGLILTIATLTLAAAILTSWRFGRPLQALADVASRIAAGDTDVRAAERGPSELRKLAAALNSAMDRHRRDQQALTSRAAQLADAQRIAQIGTWAWRPDGDVVTWSEEMHRITGTEPDDPTLVGVFSKLVEPEDLATLTAAKDAAMEGASVDAATLRIRRLDGVQRIVRMHARRVLGPDRRVDRIEGSFQDVTETTAAEHDLAEERRLNEIAGRMARVGGWSFVVADSVLHWSDLVGEIHETANDFVPDVQHGIEFYAPWARPIIREAFERVIEEGVPFDLELQIDTAKGRRVWIRTVGEAIHDDEGRIVGVAGAFQDIDARKTSEAHAVEVDRRVRGMLEALPDGFVALDPRGVPSFANHAAEALLQRKHLVEAGPLWNLLPTSVEAEIGELLRHAVANRERDTLVAADVRAGRWLELSVEPAGDELAVVIRDTTERARLTSQLYVREAELVRARDALQESLELEESLMSALPAHVALVDADGTILEVNERWRAFGRENGATDPAFGEGSNYLEIARRVRGRDAEGAAEVAEGLSMILDGKGESMTVEYPCHAPHERRWFRVEARPVAPSERGERRAVVMHVDVTESHQARERLARLAYEDPLTGLLNRTGLANELDTLATAEWPTDHVLASLDVRDMTVVNDLHGFDAGDALLRSIGDRLARHPCAPRLLARIGGDEFALLLPPTGATGAEPTGRVDGALTQLRRLVDDVSASPHELTEDLRLTAEVHVGLTRLGAIPRSSDQLLREAQLALFEGTGGSDQDWPEYTDALQREVHDRTATAAELRAAIDRDELRLYFHPKVYTRTGELYAAEALVRWQHPQRGLLSPGMFVPQAEKTGLIVPLGAWVLNEACRRLATWRTALGLKRVAVNASVEEFVQPGYVEHVLATLARHDVPPQMLTIEVTESVFARESTLVADQLHALRDAGVNVALDDFGTGYASLAYLKTFPFNHIKIDRVFVADMLTDPYSRGVIESVVALARTVGAGVIAEGVETDEERRALVDIGCEIAQGFHFSLPLDPEDFEWLLQNRRTLPLTDAP